MVYRVGRPDDYVRIKAFVESTGVYHDVEPSIMGGYWFIAEHDNAIRAAVWVFGQAPNAYVDYLAGNGIIVSRLLTRLELMFIQLGVRWVRGMIHKSNRPALRLAGAHGAQGAADYVFVAKEIKNG